MKKFHDISVCPPVSLPENPTSIEILKVLVEAERCVVGVILKFVI